MDLSYLPNIITTLRILLVLPIVAVISEKNYEWGCYLFVLAGLSDGLDGFLARRFNWASRFGSIADPLADKILLTSSLLVLAWKDAIPILLVTIIILRDIWVIAGALCYHYLISHYQMAPTALSKINTFMQILLVLAVLIDLGITPIDNSIINTIIGVTVVACVVSGIQYTYVWGRKAWAAYLARKK